jgi:hypothetical protein
MFEQKRRDRIDLGEFRLWFLMRLSMQVLLLNAVSALAFGGRCELSVKVTNPSGAPLEGVPVTLLGRDGKTIERGKTASGGRIELCRARKGQYEVEVGDEDTCFRPLFRSVTAWPERYIELAVVLPPCIGGNGWTANYCSFVFTLADAKTGEELGDATLQTDAGKVVGRSTENGRVALRMYLNESIVLSAAKSGYSTTPLVEYRCRTILDSTWVDLQLDPVP